MKLAQVTLVTGGCRSGKSRFALNKAEEMAVEGRIFIATSRVLDDEMKQRVACHQKDRGESWKTVECPVNLPETITTQGKTANVLLVDCITMYVSNLMLDDALSSHIHAHIDNLEEAIKLSACPVVMVTNEVGMGIVPENRLARAYRDLVGSVNQQLADIAHEVVLVVSGIPVWVKGKQKDQNP